MSLLRSSRLFFTAAALCFAVSCAVAPDEPAAPAAADEPARPGAVTSELDEPPASCWDQCYWAGQSCPSDCGASANECYFATETCYRSCNNGVGPWLPC